MILPREHVTREFTHNLKSGYFRSKVMYILAGSPLGFYAKNNTIALLQDLVCLLL